MNPNELRALADALHWVQYTADWQACDQAADYLRAQADAQPVAAVPAGWKMVPVEPTPEMLSAVGMMDGYDWHAPGCSPDADHATWYSAMIAAAPGFDGLDMPAFCAWLRQCAEQRPVAWRDHVEQRMNSWRQRFVNQSGDQLALDDFMDRRSLDDLIDYVCDEWAGPRAAPVPQPVAPVALVRAYNAGYMAGHHDTAEGGFVDIHPSDMDTYHADVVAELGLPAAPQAEPKRNQPLLDLLAVIHCDGGDHTEAVGLDQSIKDAQAAVCELKRELAMGKREPLSDSDADYWLRHRQAILDAIRRDGFVLMSNACGFWLKRMDKASEAHKIGGSDERD